MPNRDVDLAIVGGGILGLAVALRFSERFPALRLAVLEKETRLAAHQTGHNSGVIHSGVYYRPGSLKASLCVRGARALKEFCSKRGIPVRKCGKVIVAVSDQEVPRLEALARRGVENGISGLSCIGRERLAELEPQASGVQAIHLPEVCITDYNQIAQSYAEILRERGCRIRTGCRVLKVKENSAIHLETSQDSLSARLLINCAGLQADRLAGSRRDSSPVEIIPFRGEYFELIPSRRHLIRGLVYPVPDPAFPFLGVHLSPRIDGRVEAGPNAVLALKREGYRKTDFSIGDFSEMVRFPGFWRMAGRHWKTGLQEVYRSLNKQAFVRSVQRLVPSVQSGDLIPGGSGVRAQAVNDQGDLLDDFCVIQRRRSLHLCNAPSPAATASLAIGDYIADLAARQLSLD